MHSHPLCPAPRALPMESSSGREICEGRAVTAETVPAGVAVVPHVTRPGPSEREVKATAARTRRALEVAGAALQGPESRGTAAGAARAAAAVNWTQPRYYRWPVLEAGAQGLDFTERVIRVTDVAVDPLAVAKVRRRDVRMAPGGREEARREMVALREREGSPPPERTPREVLQAWRLPGAVSNWKNPKGFVVPLELRSAVERARGVGEEPAVNADGFMALAEALADAEDTAREDVGRRAAIRRERLARAWEEKELALRDQARLVRAERSKVHEEGGGAASSNGDPRGEEASTGMEDLEAFLEACANGGNLAPHPKDANSALDNAFRNAPPQLSPPLGHARLAEGVQDAGPPNREDEGGDDGELDALYDARLFDKARELRGIGGLSAPYDTPLFSGARAAAEARYMGPAADGDAGGVPRPGLGYRRE